MKTILILILSASMTLAGTFTVNTTAEQDLRVDAAIRAILNLDHNPTDAEVSQFLRRYLRDTVQDYERRLNMQQYVPPDFQ